MTPETRQAAAKVAKTYGIPEANLLALVEAESNGVVYAKVNGQNRPLVLFEPHVFYRLLKGDKRDDAVAAGLAYPRQGAKPYPKSQAARWAQIDAASKIDFEAGLGSASYGVGQVMGYHWSALGYNNVDHLVAAARSGVEGQIDLMMRYVKHFELIDELREGRWLALARAYNGKKYAAKYAAALEKWSNTFNGWTAAPDGLLRLGASGPRVREVQALLARAGFPVKVDGDFGPATRDAVKAFQKAAKLKIDGVVGPETEAALAAYRQGAGDKPGAQAPTEIKEVREGAGGLAGGVAIEVAQDKIDEAVRNVEPLAGSGSWVDYLLMGLTITAAVLAIAGIAWAVYGFWKSRRTVGG